MQAAIGSCGPGDVAARVLTRVTAHYPARRELGIDAGWTALTTQGAEAGFGAVEGAPGLRIARLSQVQKIISNLYLSLTRLPCLAKLTPF